MTTELSNQGTTAQQELINQALAQVNTAIPAVIKSFDPVTQTCEAQPTIKRKDGSGNDVDYPLLVDVPVIFPRAGDYMITFPVAAGDECLIVFSQRCIDSWYATGEISSQFEPRAHDLSDAIAIPGLSSQKRNIQNFATDALELRNNKNDVKMSLKNSGIFFTFGGFTLALDASGISTNAPITTSQSISAASSMKVGSQEMLDHKHNYTDDGSPAITGIPR